MLFSLRKFFFLFTILYSHLVPLQGKETKLHVLPEEIKEVTTASKSYIFTGEELTEIKSIATHIQRFIEEEGP
ncbi:TPA: hypothetical protein DCW54_01840 [Candidatus Dependentiae bacterium]|nr:hypothetical protein [Candidatus Dependentiae bacterium]